nr:serine/threonine-protein kinase haspin-like [Parasteatoda tepidariorum]
MNGNETNNYLFFSLPEHYSSDQAFIVIETELAGTDMDELKIISYLKALSIFHQVAAGLAVAEEKLQFEHRDLHPGNILIKKCGNDEKLDVCLRGERYQVETYGIKVTIIDFTYSRLQTGKNKYCTKIITGSSKNT